MREFDEIIFGPLSEVISEEEEAFNKPLEGLFQKEENGITSDNCTIIPLSKLRIYRQRAKIFYTLEKIEKTLLVERKLNPTLTISLHCQHHMPCIVPEVGPGIPYFHPSAKIGMYHVPKRENTSYAS